MTRRLERHRIGRGSLRNVRPLIVATVLAVPVFLVLLPVLLDMLRVEQATAMGVGTGAFLLTLVGLLTFLNLPGTATIGDDGVLVDTRGARRFVPFAELLGVDRFEDRAAGKRIVGVVLELRRGDEVRIALGEDHFGGAERREALLARLREGLEAFRANGGDGAGAAEALAPGDVPTDRWAERLRQVGTGVAAGPRIAAVPAERLWRTVEDPAEDAVTRAAAAFALRDGADAAGRERLRSLAAGSADPSLRVALAAAAEAEDAAALEALDAVRAARTERRS